MLSKTCETCNFVAAALNCQTTKENYTADIGINEKLRAL